MLLWVLRIIGISELLEQAKNSISEFEPEFKGFVFAERFDFITGYRRRCVVITSQKTVILF